ncbi:hypothetical protein [Lysinibacillus sp. G4S2]|uniref:hypothetical protein n=1 Tax=Lysinibacillus sp. G4S2 TaxID=3055859 RepID=UPI0025A2BC11|nr:hypothetical protein [Lysinibacillus sp. G4S2]MDM5250084.1 hypothetical protein [Lysinibacillus sp. G4S2]
MISILMQIKLNRFLENHNSKEIIKDTKNQILEEEEYGDIESLGVFGHSLSNFQLSKLDSRLSNSKKSLTVGQYLRKLTSERGIHSFSENRFGEAQITKTYWSRILNDKYKTHDKDKLIRIAIFLKLSLKETMKLLYKAGFTLSVENKKDEIIAFCLEEGIYNLYDIEELLAENNLPTLFSKVRSIEK